MSFVLLFGMAFRYWKIVLPSWWFVSKSLPDRCDFKLLNSQKSQGDRQCCRGKGISIPTPIPFPQNFCGNPHGDPHVDLHMDIPIWISPYGTPYGYPYGEIHMGIPTGKKSYSHSHPIPMGMRIHMGIPIPTATLEIGLGCMVDVEALQSPRTLTYPSQAEFCEVWHYHGEYVGLCKSYVVASLCSAVPLQKCNYRHKTLPLLFAL